MSCPGDGHEKRERERSAELLFRHDGRIRWAAVEFMINLIGIATGLSAACKINPVGEPGSFRLQRQPAKLRQSRCEGSH